MLLLGKLILVGGVVSLAMFVIAEYRRQGIMSKSRSRVEAIYGQMEVGAEIDTGSDNLDRFLKEANVRFGPIVRYEVQEVYCDFSGNPTVVQVRAMRRHGQSMEVLKFYLNGDVWATFGEDRPLGQVLSVYIG